MINLKKSHIFKGTLYLGGDYLSDGTWMLRRALIKNEALFRTPEQAAAQGIKASVLPEPAQDMIDRLLSPQSELEHEFYDRTNWHHMGDELHTVLYRAESGKVAFLRWEVVQLLDQKSDTFYWPGSGPATPGEWEPGQPVDFLVVPVLFSDSVQLPV